ncbi:hypothetical protein RL73_00680 [Liberibacter crescens]|nr:hypothetical protein RL73_00680 [Liberibacter crescens]
MSRYNQQIMLPEIGEEGQALLHCAHVLIIGAGGLSSTLLPILTGAGIGTISLYDEDHVEEKNLHRQTLFTMNDINHFKAKVAATRLESINPDCKIKPYIQRLTPANVAEAVAPADIIIDAADNFAVTYILSDACLDNKKPFVSASVLGLLGFVGCFCNEAPSYRAVFPSLPSQANSCSTTGVLGGVVSIIASIQAQLVLAYLLKFKPAPPGLMITFNGHGFIFGSFSFLNAPEPEENKKIPFISMNNICSSDIIFDLRSVEEMPSLPIKESIRLSLEDIPLWASNLSGNREQRIVFCCRSGLRAANAAYYFKEAGFSKVALIAFSAT